MSIAVLNQVYDETRRLAVAGSNVAPGDFRLAKLVPPLQQAGAKAPVFAKVAELVQAVVDSKEATAAPALLELASLVSAVLYTQGETGLPGELEPIESTDLGTTAQKTTARVLKPLLEALSTTGAGRLELIKDAVERGSFDDLRLVKPALAAIDDHYGEIADLMATRVLPRYGRAILPELRAKFDPKGKIGHARRLRLMHGLDPAGTRPLVEHVLEEGSKEVRVAAIECLGAEAKDVAFLVEQSAAKAGEVRVAAYSALARLEHPDAVRTLQAVAASKDVTSAVHGLTTSRHPAVLKSLISEVERRLAALFAEAEKKAISELIRQLLLLVQCFRQREDGESERLLRGIFDQRAALFQRKGDTQSGADLNKAVVLAMATGSRPLQEYLATAHASLPSTDLAAAFVAGRRVWSMDRVFREFSPYLAAAADRKKKANTEGREAIVRNIAHASYEYRRSYDEQLPPLDPRWLDVAIAAGELGMIQVLGRPGHAPLNAYLSRAFADAMASKKPSDATPGIVFAMVRAQHPDVIDAFLTAVEAIDKKAWYSLYTFEHLIPDLPASAIPKLEAMLSKLPDRDADRWLDRIQQLRSRHLPPT